MLPIKMLPILAAEKLLSGVELAQKPEAERCWGGEGASKLIDTPSPPAVGASSSGGSDPPQHLAHELGGMGVGGSDPLPSTWHHLMGGL